MKPWSVVATAGMPSWAVRARRSSIRAAPSSMEYSVWLCRCTKFSPGFGDCEDVMAENGTEAGSGDIGHHSKPAHRPCPACPHGQGVRQVCGVAQRTCSRPDWCRVRSARTGSSPAMVQCMPARLARCLTVSYTHLRAHETVLDL